MRKKIITLSSLLIFFLLISNYFIGHVLSENKESKENNEKTLKETSLFSSNELLIKIDQDSIKKVKENATDTGLEQLNTVFKESKVKEFSRLAKTKSPDSELFRWYLIKLDKKHELVENDKDLSFLTSKLYRTKGIEKVELNYQVSAYRVPNDPFYSSNGSWGQAYPDMWGMKKINPEPAWDQNVGNPSAIIADIDTGADIYHSDLYDNIWTNPDEIPNNGIDDDGNGYIDDVSGWNFITNNNNIADDNGHGTHTAGTIGAVGNNAVGVVGVNWITKIMVLKFLDSGGSGYISDGIKALQYAADNGAKISSNSWGCKCNSSAMDDAVKYEHDRGMLTVVAAGNSSSDALDYSPASSTYALTVSASDPNDAFASFSNRGEKIDVAAPGVDILSTRSSFDKICANTVIGMKYCRLSGTSMATPHVAGLAALLLAKDPTLTNEELRQIIRRGANDLGNNGKDPYFGYGRINVSDSMNILSPKPLAPVITNLRRDSLLQGTEVQILGSIPGPSFASYKIQYGSGRSPANWIDLYTSNNQVIDGVLATIDSTNLPAGTVILRLTAYNTEGKIYQFQVEDLRVANIPYIKPGFPVQTGHYPGTYAAGPAIHTLVGNIDNDSNLEIMATGLAVGPLYAWNADGSLVSGWPVVNMEGAAYPVLGKFSQSSYDQVFAGYFTSYAPYNIAIYNPDGSFAPGWPKDGSNYISGPGSAADIDHDGLDEVITGEEDWELHCYKANGTVCSGWPVRANNGQDMHTPAIADINQDGELEIISISGWISGGVEMYAYRPDGQALPGFPVHFSNGETNSFVVVGDVDGDSQLELVTVMTEDAYPWRQIVKIINPSGVVENSILLNDSTGYGTAPALADIDQDLIPEIIVQMDNSLVVLKGNGTVLWSLSYSDYWLGNSAPVVGDIDGDGSPDIVFVFHTGGQGRTGKVYAYNRFGQILPQFPMTLNIGSGAVPAIADIDNDGRNDLIITGSYWNGVSGNFDKVWAFDLNGNGPYGKIEWGQFGGNAKHTGYYSGGYQPTPTPTPTATPTPTVTPTPTLTPTPTPTPNCTSCFRGVCDGVCHPKKEDPTCPDCQGQVTPTPTPSVPPEPTPTPDPGCNYCFKGVCDGVCHPNKDNPGCPDCNLGQNFTKPIENGSVIKQSLASLLQPITEFFSQLF